ncbi:unnamed protein product [Durusdinium trenchii]|uniref:C3H1-type domain-containing protein n=1 Tax=Durusdinium trenchii TaxID=1381693 RepID=A0ABP0I8H4_9DINO
MATLRLFRTFIDQEEDIADAAARRARSLPPASHKSASNLEEESEYVATLLARSAETFQAPELEAVEAVEAMLEAEELQEDEALQPLTLGSRGHPVLCRRACVWFAKGECSLGATCPYCHLHHEHVVVSLDKRQRRLLQDMDLSTLLATLLPHIRTAIAAADLPPNSLLATLSAHAAAPLAAVHDRTLDRRLHRMPLSALLSCITSRHRDFGVLLQEHVDDLRREMPR